MNYKDKKVFVIINSYFIGDILIVNSMVQNIKNIYPDSLVVMLTSPALADVAKYQEGVDDVVIWDRHGKHHGGWNTIKFALNFPYKKIYAAFPIYSSDRPIMLSYLLHAKYVLGYKRYLLSYFMRSRYKIPKHFGWVQDSNINLLKGITKEEIINYPIKYNVPPITAKITALLDNSAGDFVALCPKSSRVEKDLDNDFVSELIQNSKHKIVLLGNGETATELSLFLKDKNYGNLTDLTNKTSILESAQILSLSKGCIAVDTGMLHFACALDVPTLGVYMNEFNNTYTPHTEIYPKFKGIIKTTPNELLDALSTILE